MKRFLISPKLMLFVGSCFAHSSFVGVSLAQQYDMTQASPYTEIFGQLESDAPDNQFAPEPPFSAFSNESTVDQFSNGPTVDQFSNGPHSGAVAKQDSIAVLNPNEHSRPAIDWHQTEAGQLWSESPRRATDRWYDGDMRLQFGIDYLYFTRGAAADNFFAANNEGQTFSLADIDPGNETTLRYRFLIASEGGTGFEFTAYDFNDFSGSLTLEGEGIEPIFFNLVPQDPADSYEAKYTSRLKNYEANVWGRKSERLRLGYGLRYLNLDENFDIEFQNSDTGNSGPTPTGTTGTEEISGFFSRTDNQIFGGQLMVQLFHPVSKGFYVTGGASGGYGYNRIVVDQNTANIDSRSEDSNGTGFVGFFGGATLRVTDGLSLNAGYEGLLITSVALSPDQSAGTSVVGASEIQTGALLFGGAYFGGVLSF